MSESVIAHDKLSDSALTIAAIGILAYISCDLLHEIIGHGGSCLVTAGHPSTFSTVHFQCFGGWQRFISSAGILSNILVGGALWLTLRRHMIISIHLRYFLWISLAYNLFSGWGYVLSSGLTNSGDLAATFHGQSPAWHWRLIAAVVGSLFYALSIWIVAGQLRFLIGPGYPARLWKLILFAYFSSAIVACLAGALNQILNPRLAVPLAISTTLGCWGFLFLPLLLLHGRSDPVQAAPPIPRSLGWIITATLASAVFIGVLGPGLRLR